MTPETYCFGPSAFIMTLAREAEQCTKVAGVKLEPSGATPEEIATAAVAECASDHSFLAMVDAYCRMAVGDVWVAPDWRNGVRAAAVDGVISARAARASASPLH